MRRRDRILGYFGLTRPYRFARAVLGGYALLLVALTLVAMLRMYRSTDLDLFAPRMDYFYYLLALGAVALLTLRWPRVAASVLALQLAEFLLGYGSFVLVSYGLAEVQLLPVNNIDLPAFKWHALLQAVPAPSQTGGEGDGLYTHTSEGTRGREPTVEELATHRIVALFGGSTTYDIALSDEHSWPHQLERILGGDRYLVINHGVPGFSTAQNLIQTVFYESAFGKTPRCAVYYEGWNDLRNLHIDHLDPAYADYALPSQVDVLQTRRMSDIDVLFSPLVTLVSRAGSALFDTIRYPATPPGRMSGEPDRMLETYFMRNIRSISALNRSRGVRTLWIPQQMNRAQLTGVEPDFWVPLLPKQDTWPILQRFNALLLETAHQLSDAVVDIPSDTFVSADFVDEGHFSEQGALKFARLVAPIVARECQ